MAPVKKHRYFTGLGRGAIRARNKSGNCAGGASTVSCGRCENYSVKPDRPTTDGSFFASALLPLYDSVGVMLFRLGWKKCFSLGDTPSALLLL